MILLIAAFAAIFAFCAIMIIVVALRSDEIAMSDRISKLAKKTAKADTATARQRRRATRARRFKAGSKISAQLESAGILLRAEEFILAWAGATLVPSGLVLFFGGNAVTAIGLALLGAFVPPILVASARKRRLALFEKQLGDALSIISNCLRAGFTFQQAMESIANEMAEPISKEFGKTLREMQLGVPMDTAMEGIVRRMCNDDLGMLVSAVLIQRQVGGNLADVIDNISVTIRDRLKIKGDIKVMSASGRISGTVIGLLPVFLMGVLMLLNPNYIMNFFNSPLGIAMLVIAGTMEFIGFMIVQKIVDIKL
jgi:tight adherence protein B